MSDQHSTVTVIIPQFNQFDLTANCIASIRRFDPHRWPILVIDDGSDADSEPFSRAAELEPLRIIRQPHRGVSSAWNRGAEEARSDFLVFLNNDVMADGPFIERLIAPLQSSAAMAGVRLRTEHRLPKRLQSRLRSTRFLEGWCFAVARRDWQCLKGFDESMTVYWSDTDFQLRLIALYGSRRAVAADRLLAATADLALRHFGHRTTRTCGDRTICWRADRRTFVKKWERA